LADRATSLVTGAVTALLSAYGVFWLIPAHTGDARTANDIAPAMVPSVALGTCLLLALLLMVRAWRAPRDAGAAHTTADTAGNAPVSGPALLADLAIWAFASLATFVLLRHAGFLVTGTLVIAAWMLFCGERSPLRIAALALGVPILLDRLSWYALSVPLP
jgi:hypothetical protein